MPARRMRQVQSEIFQIAPASFSEWSLVVTKVASGSEAHGLLSNRAGQFTTRVNGLFVLLLVMITNRFPSEVTS